MSIRRNPGEVVRRKPGSGFIGGIEPEFVKVPEGENFDNNCICMLCDDTECREWSNLEVLDEFGKPLEPKDYIYHISECEMETVCPF